MSPLRCALSVWMVAAIGGCDGPAATPDAGADELGCGRGLMIAPLRWSMPSLGTVVGGTREVYVELERDCQRELEVTLSVSRAGVAELPASVTIPANRSRARLSFTGLAEGTVTVTASASHAPSEQTVSADVELAVVASALPACDGTASGSLAPGGEVAVSAGALAGAAIALPEGAGRADAYHVDAFETSLGCAAADIVPDGYRALGPAVTFGPESARFGRELPLTVPIRLALLPDGAHRGHVEVAYLGAHGEAPSVVPIASPRFDGSAGGGTLTFEAPRLGTYQAVVPEDAPTRRMRRFTFRGILGFSMGGSGSGRIGFGNPERFDFVAPLGGPTDWTFMLEHIRRYHVAGFCTEEERLADPVGCAMGSAVARTPPPTHLHEHAQHFEHWWYDDGYEGQGGTFNRSDYISIFRDLAAMFGNPNYDHSADTSAPNITPPGVPDSMRAMSPTLRCMPENQIVIPPDDGSPGTGFFDDEFNPDGSYPVITFCDGAETGDIGQWNPDGGNNMPIEVVVAVDVDGDGIRDPGEPVIRNGREPFDDFGLDGVPNEREVSADGTPYDAVSNPDPAGDDFDFQYNPTGTENNWDRDSVDGDPCRPGEDGVAEHFLDVGIDGVMGTRQLDAGGFDAGEDNGCFDRTRGAQRMIESSPRYQVERMDRDTLLDTDLFADGGIRDLFNWVVMGNVTTAGWASQGLPVRYYNGHASLHMNGAADFDFFAVPWAEVGRATMVRYGSPDVEDRFLRAGDGGHVGTGQQIIDRLRAGLMVMDARWPDGSRERVTHDQICPRIGDNCPNINSLTIDFTASTGRTGPVSIVLPPGYFDDTSGPGYPVVYFLHGYGMEPDDLIALGLLMWAAMNTPSVGTERRMQKMILVFPDGRCRNDECLRGTFYTDAPDSTPNGAQMQTFLLDLMDYVDETYRTRDPEVFEVVE